VREFLYEAMKIFSSTDNQSDLLVAGEVIYRHSILEYPDSTEHGVAYVVDVKDKSADERNCYSRTNAAWKLGLWASINEDSKLKERKEKWRGEKVICREYWRFG
jgi:hypothetical protein